MRSYGIVRKMDQLGRIVLPKETRREFLILEGTSLEIYIDGDKIILKKYNPGCTFCESLDDLIQIEEKKVCNNCAERISEYYKKNKGL